MSGRREGFDTHLQEQGQASQAQADLIAAARRVAGNIKARVDEGMAGRGWVSLPVSTRVTLVLLALPTLPPGADEWAVARRPWQSFTDDERNFLGSTARQLVRELSAVAEALR